MADTKITALAAITTVDPAADVLPIVDISDTSMAASGTTKKITSNQILGAGGTATLASATITGDLTVDTSTLKVDSANNRVGIGTASPLNTLHVLGSATGSVGRIVGGATGQPLFLYSDASGSGVNNGSSGSYGTGLYFSNASNFLAFYTDSGGGGTEKARIDSSGNVGVGVAPSAWQSGLKAIQFAANGVLYGNGTNSAFFGNNYYTDSGGTNRYIVSNAALAYGQTAGAHQWFIAPAGTAGNAITFTQAMTLDASGNLLVGTTSQIRGGKLSVDSSAGVASGLKSSAGSSVFVEELWNTGSLDNSFINFGTDSTFTARGSITYNRSGGLVAYNTTSDYRAKDIIGPVSNSGSVIDSLKVYIGKMKGASVERPMLVAHEAQIVAPYSVTGQKDEVDADGNPKYQQMDVSSFVPLLIAEIQSLRTRVQTLEAR